LGQIYNVRNMGNTLKLPIELLNEHYRLILASKSPRRHQLLHEMGLKFNIWTHRPINEELPIGIKPQSAALYLAEKKAEAYVHDLSPNDILLTCDTVVIYGKHILNKPKNAEDARQMLKTLSGKKHAVITGICLRTYQKQILTSDTTYVWFSLLTQWEIDYYLDQFQPFDKAGAYGIQEWIGLIGITKIQGSYFNVVGLPTSLVYQKLSQIITT